MQTNISILLSTYNGEQYLKQQLDSLFTQSYNNFTIIARDDGSTDDTLHILKSYDNIKVLDTTQNLGAKGSFSALLEYALIHTDSEYFMFCDQDDVWEKDKIEKTLSKMETKHKEYPNLPILIHTNLKLADENMKVSHDSFWEHEFILPQFNTFSRLLIQNTITGCTVMINRKLAQQSLEIPSLAIMHDWWLGLVASKFGKIYYVDEATIKYRQHDNNTIGAKGFTPTNSILEALYLLLTMFRNKGEYIKTLHINIDQAKAFLHSYRKQLDNQTIHMLEDFIDIEKKTFLQKRIILLKYKLFKQGLIRNIGLLLQI